MLHRIARGGIIVSKWAEAKCYFFTASLYIYNLRHVPHALNCPSLLTPETANPTPQNSQL
jgi:hypothetical protein